MCKMPIQLSGDVLAAFLSDFGDVEDFSTIKSSSSTVTTLLPCAETEGFKQYPIHSTMRTK